MLGSSPPTTRSAWSHLPPHQQIGYGCLAIAVIGAFVLYCAGTFSILIRPTLVQRAPTPTIITRMANLTPTRPPATLMNLPGGTLLATPTQAPIPTREPPTVAPTLEWTSPPPLTVSASPASATRTPTRRITGTVTQSPRP